MDKKTLENVIECPYCKDRDYKLVRVVSVNFDNYNTGEYTAIYHCHNCTNQFEVFTEFKYSII